MHKLVFTRHLCTERITEINSQTKTDPGKMEPVKPNLTAITKTKSEKVSPSCQDYFVSPKTKNGKSIIQYMQLLMIPHT